MHLVIIVDLVITEFPDFLRNPEHPGEIFPYHEVQRFFIAMAGIGKDDKKWILMLFKPFIGLYIIINGAVKRCKMGISIVHQPGESFLASPDGIG